MKIYRKVFIGAMTLFLLVITFTASTFAWFQINNSANISGFEFTATSGQGFLISIDNRSFSNDLSRNQMEKAILLGLDSNTYELNSKGNIVYKTSKIELSDSQIDEILKKKIELLPVTSTNGYEFTDMHGSSQKPSSGRFVEFDLYFKTTSPEQGDELKYDISLLVGTTVQDEGKTVMPSGINGNVDEIELVADMNTINGNLVANDKISVYSANAMRFSIEENIDGQEEVTEQQRNENTVIYEFYNASDLGSYPVKNNGGDVYNPEKNASFTYYNNQKASKIEALDSMPSTIRYNQTLNVIEECSNEGVKQLTNMPTITQVSSGSSSKRITFRVWLEGWDADCFDGLAKSVKVNFTFTSKKV